MSTELAIRHDQSAFTPAQTAALKRSIGVEDVPDEELAVFFHQAVRTGLDPFARQLYLIPRWNGRKKRNDYTVQVSIDGARLIADRTGRYAGSDVPEFGHDAKERPWANVTVWKLVDGVRCPFTGVAFWDEYVQLDREGKPSGLWAKMPRTMLAKCAEMQALRKAFPADLSGLYTQEELDQADSEATPAVRQKVRNSPAAALPPVDAATGEIVDAPTVSEADVKAAQQSWEPGSE